MFYIQTDIHYSILSVAILFLFASNSNDLAEQYRLNKKFWDVKDYKNAVSKIKYTNKKEKKPCYAVPEKAPIFRKVIDKNNISVVIEDEELGLNHRSEFASEMFDQYRNLVEVYQDIDREDKFVYPMELTDILKFGLYLQLHYFDLGNQAIIQKADNPDASDVKRVLRSNEQTLIGNYCIYLGFIKQEHSFSDEALDSYVDGVNEYFPMVIDKFPDANFNEMTKKAKDMLKKTESQKVKTALSNLLSKLESDQTEE
jgi:hypothetical protein